jgi:hypothetical protein
MNEQDYPPLPAGVRVGSATYLLMKMWVNADRAQQSARHAEELLSYEVTVGNLRAQLEQKMPDGCTLVPLEPTADMYIRGGEAFFDLIDHATDDGDTEEDQEHAASIYRAMLSAAPQAQPERKPMTDGEKLYAMWHSSDANDLDDFLDGWRHAEAFHGIKEKP